MSQCNDTLYYIFAAYCVNDTLPKMPERASNTTTEATDVPGQVITYTCDTGFEFVGSPVSAGVTVPTTEPPTTTTPPPLTWHTFKGADYALGEESSAVTWDEARALCQSRNADLASISSFEVQHFINDKLGESSHRWIGATDSASEGTMAWSNGADWTYWNWQTSLGDCASSATPPGNSNTKNCVNIQHNRDGRWEIRECASDSVQKYVCMRGTSSSTIWTTIQGAEYSYMKHSRCMESWQDAKALCELYGGDIGSILHDDVTTELFDYYATQAADAIQADFWIGLNDIASEGAYKWENGDTYQWNNFRGANDRRNGDCVRVYQGSKEWNTEPCDSTGIDAVLCMKGTSAIADATCTITNRQSSRTYDNHCTFSAGSSSTSGGGYDELACCMRCEGFSGIGAVTVRSDFNGCWCEDKSPSGCSSPGSISGYNTADCTCASKRKRRSTFNDSVIIDNLLEDTVETSSVKQSNKETGNLRSSLQALNHHQRYVRQAVDPTKQRQISCEWGWNSEASVAGGYWSFEHEVPEYCFSKYRLSIISDFL